MPALPECEAGVLPRSSPGNLRCVWEDKGYRSSTRLYFKPLVRFIQSAGFIQMQDRIDCQPQIAEN